MTTHQSRLLISWRAYWKHPWPRSKIAERRSKTELSLLTQTHYNGTRVGPIFDKVEWMELHSGTWSISGRSLRLLSGGDSTSTSTSTQFDLNRLAIRFNFTEIENEARKRKGKALEIALAMEITAIEWVECLLPEESQSEMRMESKANCHSVSQSVGLSQGSQAQPSLDVWVIRVIQERQLECTHRQGDWGSRSGKRGHSSVERSSAFACSSTTTSPLGQLV